MRPGAPVAVAAVTAASFAATRARRSARRRSLTALNSDAVARRTATASGCSASRPSAARSTRMQTSRSSGAIPPASFATERTLPKPPAGYDRPMPDRLYFTDSDAANALNAREPMALLVGFALDQQVSVPKAFAGPLAIQERLGSLEPAALAAADLEPVFRGRPAVHRFPGAMAKRGPELAVHIRDTYGGDAARVWTQAADAGELRANLQA